MMKNRLLIVGLLLMTAITFGQKKEIKKAEKAVKSGDFTEAMSLLSQAEGMLSSADTEEKVSFYMTRAEANTNNLASSFDNLADAAKDLQKAVEIDPATSNTSRYEDAVNVLKQKMAESAVKDFNSNSYKAASDKFYTAYSISKSDTIYLANAAISAKNGKDYEKAINYYEKLIEIGYSDIKKQYIATNKETGKVETYNTKPERDLVLKAGTHILPGEQLTTSKQEDFLNNLTLLYLESGENDKALALLTDLRKKNPGDVRLLRAEAEIHNKLGNTAKYNELITELISKDPNNPELYFNLGVTSSKAGDKEKAKEFYIKAIELDPDYAGAQINMASMILDSQQPIVEEMNGLGTSNADYKRYDELKAKLTETQRSSIPYLEAAVRLRPDDIDFARTLMNIYTQVGEDAKAKEMKAKVEAMEGGE